MRENCRGIPASPQLRIVLLLKNKILVSK